MRKETKKKHTAIKLHCLQLFFEKTSERCINNVTLVQAKLN